MNPETLIEDFIATRQRSVADCQPLRIEDYALQAAEFASPPKWHLAHTSWFFETFLLQPFVEGYRSPNPHYAVLFNSYYNGIGEQHPRGRRGLLSRPDLSEVLEYREQVDRAMIALLSDRQNSQREHVLARTTLGLEHERQHQELLYTDIKYSLAANPLYPAMVSGVRVSGVRVSDIRVSNTGSSGDGAADNRTPDVRESESNSASSNPARWLSYSPGLVEMGYESEGFCFDNELPRHRTFIPPFEIAAGLVTNAQYQQFIDDGGYRRPEFWLADGWAAVNANSWSGPLYWRDLDGSKFEYTLEGLQPRVESNPVCHVSAYEADAYARWSGARLPTEAEWEWMARAEGEPSIGRDTHNRLHPYNSEYQCYGSCWQWTQSAYSPYPGFSASADAIGEYNGKFMSNQWVLRGGSCVTWSTQARPTYRNFFYPQDRWQFSGIRLAR